MRRRARAFLLPQPTHLLDMSLRVCVALQVGVTPPINPTLSVGMRVKARFMASSKGPNIAKYWFHGTVRNIHTDGTCDIDCEWHCLEELHRLQPSKALCSPASSCLFPAPRIRLAARLLCSQMRTVTSLNSTRTTFDMLIVTLR